VPNTRRCTPEKAARVEKVASQLIKSLSVLEVDDETALLALLHAAALVGHRYIGYSNDPVAVKGNLGRGVESIQKHWESAIAAPRPAELLALTPASSSVM
jgi:hypothetical protein